jgi:hypothetical protein
MDSSYSYPQLFDIDDTFNADMFHGLALPDHHHNNNTNNNNITNNNTHRHNNNTNTPQEKKQFQCQQQQQQHHQQQQQQQHIQHQLHQHPQQQVASTNDDIYNSLASSNSYLQYLQTSPIHNSMDMFYDANAAYGQINLDYDYMHMDQKQQYNWLYDSIDAYLPNHTTAPHSFFCQDSLSSSLGTPNPMDCMMTDSTEEIKIEGGMSRDYVSLNVSKE